MRTRALAALFTSAILAACGGGGGGGDAGNADGTLYVSASYGSTPINLFVPATVQPTVHGFNGHAPSCSITAGSVPPGMEMQSNCSITGRPTQAGRFFFTLSVRGAGVANALSLPASLSVNGPKIFYEGHADFLNGLLVGAAVNDGPAISNWAAAPGMQLAWSYAIANGSLPPGLSLDPITGQVTGTARMQGAFSATIVAVMSTIYGDYHPDNATYAANVSVAPFDFVNTGGTGANEQSVPLAYISQPALFEASSPGGSVSHVNLNGATLPAGLALDPLTNVISGTVQIQATGVQSFEGMTATVTNNGVSTNSVGRWRVDIEYPILVRYRWAQGTVGTPLILAPDSPPSPIALVAPSYTYTPLPGSCTLPAGMSLDAGTGVLSGTPTTAGAYDCEMDVDVTNNGVSWTQHVSMAFLVS